MDEYILLLLYIITVLLTLLLITVLLIKIYGIKFNKLPMTTVTPKQQITISNDVNKNIPLIIHQTWKSWGVIKPKIYRVIRNNLNILGPKVEYRFYSDHDCWQYIKDNFPPNVLTAYESINPDGGGAMRADLFRYCVMYKDGGLYLDIKSKLTDNPFAHLKPSDSAILFTCPGDCGEKYRRPLPFQNFEQWILLFKPKHPLMKEILYKCVDNILNKYMGPKLMKAGESLPSDHDYHDTIEVEDYSQEIAASRRKAHVLWISGPDMMSLVIHTSKNKDFDIWWFSDYALLKTFGYSVTDLYTDKTSHYSYSNKNIYLQ